MNDLNITISHDSHNNGADIYRITTEAGAIDAVHHPSEMRYTIANFDVYLQRRRGIGKELLRASRNHAKTLGAKVIFAAIISRECLDAMKAVFGEDAVHVSELGDYASEGEDYSQNPTAAVLYVEIED